MNHRVIAYSVAAIFAVTAQAAYGGGFGIATQSGPGAGNAFSGGAAVAEDASVVWTNPAAMSLLPQGKHFAGAVHALKPSFKFRNEGSSAFLGTDEGGDGGDWAFVPTSYFAMSLGNNLSVGVGLNAPFGLKTEYPQGWIGQNIALTSEIKAVNLNPAIAYKISPNLSIGAGVSLQYLEAKLTNAAGAPLGTAKLKADDVGYGFNVGVALQATPSTRFGLHYRSSIRYNLDGDIRFSTLSAANADASADLRVPENVSVSVFSALTPQWDIMADITWTRWSRIKEVVPTCESVSAVCAASGRPIPGATLPTEWKDTWRVGVGANYRYSPSWKFRVGLAYDPTPTRDTYRTARLPDEDRLWIALGAQYTVSRNGRIDFGYVHEFIRDADVSTRVGATPLRQVGRFENRVDILTIGYSHQF